jgi:hypothetical protein
MVDDDTEENIPIAQELARIGLPAPYTYLVVGIPVQSIDQARKVQRLLWISLAWMIMVSIDHTASILYSNMHARDLHNCRTATVQASDSPRSTDYQTYTSLVLVGYIISWCVAIAIPCIGYTGARRRLRGHINVFRLFGGCFAGISIIVTLDNLLSALRAGSLTEEYYNSIHASCRNLAINAEITYSIFGFISFLLAMTQCTAFSFANTVYNDIDFWSQNVRIHPAPAPAIIPQNEMEDSEGQTTRVPFASIELNQPYPPNLRSLTSGRNGSLIQPIHVRNFEDMQQIEAKRADNDDDVGEIPIAVVVRRS